MSFHGMPVTSGAPYHSAKAIPFGLRSGLVGAVAEEATLDMAAGAWRGHP